MSISRSAHILDQLGSAAGSALSRARQLLSTDPGGKRRLRKNLKFLLGSQWFPEAWHLEHQREELRRLVWFAATHIPFYRECLRATGIGPDEIQSLDQLAQFPIISKSDIEDNIDSFVFSDQRSRRTTLKSPWFSHSPTRFPIDEQAALMEEALLLRHWETCGYEVGRPVIYVVGGREQAGGDNCRYDRVYNWHTFVLGVSPDKNLDLLCRRMKAIKADFIFGYPGSLELLADSVLQWGIELTFQGVMTGWEILTDEIRNKLEAAFNAKVYDWYGSSFPTAAMGQCHYCDGYHLFSEQGILEIVDFQGQRVTQRGKLGRIVVTNFTNRALPLIRYDTGDLGIYSGEVCRCGRGLPKPVDRIAGRSRDLLVGKDGKYIEPSTLYTLFSTSGIPAANFRLISTGGNRFSVILAIGPRSRDEIVERLKSKLVKVIGGDPVIKIDFVDKMETESGKIRPIETKIAVGKTASPV